MGDDTGIGDLGPLDEGDLPWRRFQAPVERLVERAQGAACNDGVRTIRTGRRHASPLGMGLDKYALPPRGEMKEVPIRATPASGPARVEHGEGCRTRRLTPTWAPGGA